jgi:F-type H+-transporting ATPase subunit b
LVLYKPIRSILLQRKDKIDGLEKGIGLANKETELKNQAFSVGLKEARLKGQQEKEALMQAAQEEEKAIVSRINASAQEELAAVKGKIARDVNNVRVTLEKEIDTFAEAITSKILGRVA